MSLPDGITWYAIGMFISVLTPSLLYLWNGCTGNICGGVHSWLFMLVAKKFNVEEHRFDGVSNLGAMSRVLRQAGLRTGRHRWNHDANADAGDSYQVGTVRFPIKSYCLWTLALLGITHYIWMKDDGSVVVMTGPREAVDILVRISNSAVNRQASESEIAELMAVLEDGPMEEKCCLLDLVLTAGLASVLSFVFGIRHQSIYLNLIDLVCGFTACCFTVYYISQLYGLQRLHCRSCNNCEAILKLSNFKFLFFRFYLFCNLLRYIVLFSCFFYFIRKVTIAEIRACILMSLHKDMKQKYDFPSFILLLFIIVL